MSMSEYAATAGRWLKTAEDDLRAAHTLAESGMFAHACFLSQQCAEKAAKALWYRLATEPWGHSVQKLLSEVPAEGLRPRAAELVRDAARLDR